MTEDYEKFIAKYDKKRKNKDDCFTPPAIYQAVLDWTIEKYNLQGRPVVRPFYPDGDYEKYEYPEGCVVIDNPPFSILKPILDFYNDKNIDYFIFCIGTMAFSNLRTTPKTNLVLPQITIEYDNGALIKTAFYTNLGKDKILVAGTLTDALKKAQLKRLGDTSGYIVRDYPPWFVTSARLSKYAQFGKDVGLKNLAFLRDTKDGTSFFGDGGVLDDKDLEAMTPLYEEYAKRIQLPENSYKELEEIRKELNQKNKG